MGAQILLIELDWYLERNTFLTKYLYLERNTFLTKYLYLERITFLTKYLYLERNTFFEDLPKHCLSPPWPPILSLRGVMRASICKRIP